MINLRYHIVSITAVFLALGIGVALGGTFLDRATVDLLEGNIGRAETRIRETEARNDELADLLRRAEQRDDSLVEVGEVELFEGLLTDTPVLVLARPDADPETVGRVTQALRRSDADLRGVLELTDALLMTDEVDADVANAVSVHPDDLDEVREAVDSALRQVLIEAGRPDETADDGTDDGTGDTGTDGRSDPADGSDGGPDSATTTTGADGAGDELDDPADDEADGTTTPTTVADDAVRPSIVTALVEAGYLRFEPEPGVDEQTLLARAGHRYVLVASPAAGEEDPILTALLPADESNALPAVIVGDLDRERPDGTVDLVTAVRGDRTRNDLYSTVDNIGSFTGLTAMVLTVRDLEGPDRGHFGQAPGATAVLPSPGGP